MKEFVIPIAFDIVVEDDSVTEMEAAKMLASRLASKQLIGGIVDSWWMPNHPAADGSDREAILMWIPMMSYAGRVTQGESPQDSVDSMLKTMARWQSEQVDG